MSRIQVEQVCNFFSSRKILAWNIINSCVCLFRLVYRFRTYQAIYHLCVYIFLEKVRMLFIMTMVLFTFAHASRQGKRKCKARYARQTPSSSERKIGEKAPRKREQRRIHSFGRVFSRDVSSNIHSFRYRTIFPP